MKQISMFNRTGNARVITLVAITMMALASPATSSAAVAPDTAAYARVLQRFVTTEGGVRAFLTRYAPEAARAALADSKTKIAFLDHDWSLNEAQGD